MRLDGYPVDGNLIFRFGRWYTQGGMDGKVTGTVYVWHDDKEIYQVNYTYAYDPWPLINSPGGIINLGTCHKYESSGIYLTKTFEIGMVIHGYTNSNTYNLSRRVSSVSKPEGVYFTDSSGKNIELTSEENLLTFTQEPPINYSDKLTVRMNCDEAPVGFLQWSLNITYTIQ